MIRQYKTKDGKNTFRVELDLGARIDPKTGTQRRVRAFATFDTKTETLRWQRERKARADRQAFLEPSREPLHEYLTAWLAHKQGELRQPLGQATRSLFGFTSSQFLAGFPLPNCLLPPSSD